MVRAIAGVVALALVASVAVAEEDGVYNRQRGMQKRSADFDPGMSLEAVDADNAGWRDLDRRQGAVGSPMNSPYTAHALDLPYVSGKTITYHLPSGFNLAHDLIWVEQHRKLFALHRGTTSGPFRVVRVDENLTGETELSPPLTNDDAHEHADKLVYMARTDKVYVCHAGSENAPPNEIGVTAVDPVAMTYTEPFAGVNPTNWSVAESCDTDERYLYACGGNPAVIYKLDPDTGTSVGSATLTGTDRGCHTLEYGDGYLYAMIIGDGTGTNETDVWKVDASTMTVVAQKTSLLATGDESALCGQYLYVGGEISLGAPRFGQLARIDVDTMEVQEYLYFGKNSDSFWGIYCDGQYVWSGWHGSAANPVLGDFVIRFDPNTRQAVRYDTFPRQAFDMAFDGRGRVYLMGWNNTAGGGVPIWRLSEWDRPTAVTYHSVGTIPIRGAGTSGNLQFTASTKTITMTGHTDEGYRFNVGQKINIFEAANAGNNGRKTVASVASTSITVRETLVDENSSTAVIRGEPDAPIPGRAVSLMPSAVLDGTNCVLGGRTQVGSGPYINPIVCADNAGSQIDVQYRLPDDYTVSGYGYAAGVQVDAGLTICVNSGSSTTETSAMDVSCRCTGLGQAWGALSNAVNADITYLAANTQECVHVNLDCSTSAGAAYQCDPGDMMNLTIVVDAANTTNSINTNVVDLVLETPSTGMGSDVNH